MTIAPDSLLKAENTALRALVSELNQKRSLLEKNYAQLEQSNTYLQEQLEWLKRQVFGKRSERIVSQENAEQLIIEGLESDQPQETKKVVKAHTRKIKEKGNDRILLPPDLPVETLILDLPSSEKVCKETGESLVKIGEEVSYRIAQRPVSYFLKKIVRPKYAHPKKPEMGVITILLPESIIPKCRADESFLAELLTQKYVNHLPLYRIAESLEREGIKISRQLLSQWVVRCGLELRLLHKAMLERILQSSNIFIDESPVDLQDSPKCKQAYLWMIAGSDPSYQYYAFFDSRAHANVERLLGDYDGILHSDKYGAYQKLAEKGRITWCPCWSHIRRKFFEAEGDPKLRDWILMKIRHLFLLERVAWNRSPEERLAIRQEKEVPIIDELIDVVKGRLIEGKILPKSKLREAMGYFCGLIPYLKNYTIHPQARLDNNVAERALRPVAIGRKNWLFVGSPDAGVAAAVVLSLVQTCRALKINPREYLEDVMRCLPEWDVQNLHELLPDEWDRLRKQATAS